MSGIRLSFLIIGHRVRRVNDKNNGNFRHFHLSNLTRSTFDEGITIELALSGRLTRGSASVLDTPYSVTYISKNRMRLKRMQINNSSFEPCFSKIASFLQR